MKILVVAQQKGGDGKTSTLFHLAYDFAERGLRVGVVDLDIQGNASYSLSPYASGYKASQMFVAQGEELAEFFQDVKGTPGISLIEADPVLADMERSDIDEVTEAFKHNLAALGKVFDVVLIDTAPSLGAGLAIALHAADYVLSPIQIEAFSIQGIGKMLTTIENVQERNPGLTFLGMLPNKVNGRSSRQRRQLEDLQATHGSRMVPLTVGARDSIADAVAEGVPVWNIKLTAARLAGKEQRAVAAYVFEKMELTQ